MISFVESYEVSPISELQVKEERYESVDARIKIPFPLPEDVLLSRHAVKSREEKEREEERMYDPPSMYIPPPYPLAVQEVHAMDEKVSFLEEDVSCAYTAPPFPDNV